MKSVVVLGGLAAAVGIAALVSRSASAAPHTPPGASGSGPGGSPAGVQGDPLAALDDAIAAGDCPGMVDAWNALANAGRDPGPARIQAVFRACGSDLLTGALDDKASCEDLQWTMAQLIAAGGTPTDAQAQRYEDAGCDYPPAVQQTQAQVDAANLYAQASAMYQRVSDLDNQAAGVNAQIKPLADTMQALEAQYGAEKVIAVPAYVTAYNQYLALEDEYNQIIAQAQEIQGEADSLVKQADGLLGK